MSLRLAAVDGRPHLLLAALQQGSLRITVQPLPSGAESSFDIATLPTGIYSSWDAVPRGAAWTTVATEAGSAVCHLRMADEAGEATTRGTGGREVYEHPRLVRGLPRAVTAIRRGDTDDVVLLRRGPDGALVPASVAPALPSAYLHEAVAATVAGRLLLVHTSRFSGTVPLEPGGGLPYRFTWKYESVQPGTVVLESLDDDFRTTGVTLRPFGDALVFQADADGLGDRLAVFATTREGYRFATGTPDGVGWTGSGFEGAVPGADLVSPAVAAIGGTVHVAAIAVKADGTREVVVAQVAA